jgi:ER membrane protein complex subunit 1
MQLVREDALASIQVAEFVKLPKRMVVTSHAVDEEGYFERLQRHPMPGHRGYIQRGRLC